MAEKDRLQPAINEMDMDDDIIYEFETHNAVLVRNKFGYWLRRNGENPGLLIKAVSGMPTKELAIESAIKYLNRLDKN